MFDAKRQLVGFFCLVACFPAFIYNVFQCFPACSFNFQTRGGEVLRSFVKYLKFICSTILPGWSCVQSNPALGGYQSLFGHRGPHFVVFLQHFTSCFPQFLFIKPFPIASHIVFLAFSFWFLAYFLMCLLNFSSFRVSPNPSLFRRFSCMSIF